MRGALRLATRVFPNARAPVTRSVSSVTRPLNLAPDWRFYRPRHWAPTPSERDTVALAHGYASPAHVAQDDLTGIDLDALAFCAARLLSSDELPHISLVGDGANNRVFLLDFVATGRRLTARVPLPSAHLSSRVPSTAATMAFAHYFWNIPSPKLLAWSGDCNSGVGAPFIIAEFVDDVVQTPWYLLNSDQPSQNYSIIEGLARWDAAFLRSLPDRLQRVGDLAFTRDASDPSDERSYQIVPLRLHDVSPCPSGNDSIFSACSLTLEGVWMELWRHQKDVWLAHPCAPGHINIAWSRFDPDDPSSVEPVTRPAFLEVAELVRQFALRTLASLRKYPWLNSSCLSREDHAVRNVLFDQNLRVKAFIDWDDVHVLPLVSALHVPDEIMHYIPMGLPVDASWSADGEFAELPPDHPGPNPQPIYGDIGNREDLPLISYMALRSRYKTALCEADKRVAHPAMQRIQNDVVRVHALLTTGGELWWRKRDWLRRKIDGQA
ncbi:hypothetical protein AURDEDRAFT_183543 [Auricularia subglabra TFB-10046 SS5]|nr:hypothetical protein AURDEDRAFT_183543 [Auricularia subglabra TFB-10046 SS5]